MNMNTLPRAALDKTIQAEHSAQARLRRIHPWAPWIAGGLIALLAIYLIYRLVAALFAPAPHKPPPPPAKAAIARRMDVVVTEHTIGTVVAPVTVQVTAQVGGKLLAAPFTEGQIVHRGDLLFRIDPAPLRNALQQAQGTLAKDQALAVSADNDEVRYTTLYAENAISQQQRDQAVAAAKGARATVISDQAAVGTAQENLGYAQIRSPIDGKTGPLLVQPGNLVAVNGTPLVVITQIQPIIVSFNLPQTDLPQIQQQMAAGKLQAVVNVPGAPGGVEKAQVDFVSNIVASATGTIELRATFANDDGRLVPGQSVDVGATIRDLPGATVVPRDALNAGPDGDYVYVLDQKNVVSSKPVKLLNDDGTNDAIQGDVKPGQKVVTDGQMRVVPGQPVCLGKCGGARP